MTGHREPADPHEDPAALRAEVDELRRRLEERAGEFTTLRESEHMFRTLVESAKDFIFVLDRQGKVRFVNELGAQALGMRPAECVGKTHASLFRANAERQRQSIDHVIRNGTPLYIETVTEFPSGPLCLDTWLVPLRNIRGEVDMVLGVSRDTTTRKKALDDLRYRIAFEETIANISRRFINLPIDQIDDAIREALRVLGEFVGADRCSVRLFLEGGSRIDTAYEWQNPALHGKHDVATFAVSQMPWGVRALQALKPLVVASVDDLPAEASEEKKVLRELGILSVAVVPLVYGGALVGVLTFTSVRAPKKWSADTVTLLSIAGEIFANVLARKRTEEELNNMAEELVRVERIESIGILAGGIAHDFNNILAAIWGNISLARTTLPANSMALARLEEAEKALSRAKDLTQQLLTFAKGGSPVKKVVEVGALLEESSAFATRGSRVKPEARVASDLWPVEADRGQIAQVLHNLVINGVQAMPDGGTVTVTADNITVTPELGLPLTSGPYVRIAVRDHGTGIAPEHLPKLFVPYFTTKVGGSGLGLATSYNIVRKHTGLITLDTEVAKGSCFTVYLPATPHARASEGVEDHSLVRGTGRVLVVDDEESIRRSTCDMLRYLGYDPDSTAGGAEAIELYGEAMRAGNGYVAVLMDLTIPGGMGGREIVQHILAIDPDAAAIVSSGYSNDPVMSDFRTYGFRGVIRKPYGIREIGKAMHALLSRH